MGAIINFFAARTKINDFDMQLKEDLKKIQREQLVARNPVSAMTRDRVFNDLGKKTVGSKADIAKKQSILVVK